MIDKGKSIALASSIRIANFTKIQYILKLNGDIWGVFSEFKVQSNSTVYPCSAVSWWHHQMETFSSLLAICAGNSPVTGEFPTQRPVTWRFDVFFDLRLKKRLSKQSWDWWFEMPSHPLWHQCNDTISFYICPCLIVIRVFNRRLAERLS